MCTGKGTQKDQELEQDGGSRLSRSVLLQATNTELSESRKVNASLIQQNKEMSELLKSVKSTLAETPKRSKEQRARPKAPFQVKVSFSSCLYICSRSASSSEHCQECIQAGTWRSFLDSIYLKSELKLYSWAQKTHVFCIRP